MAKDESEKLLEQIKNILECSRGERVENLQNHIGLEALSPPLFHSHNDDDDAVAILHQKLKGQRRHRRNIKDTC